MSPAEISPQSAAPSPAGAPAGRIKGHATAAGTKRFGDRFDSGFTPDFYRRTAQNLTFSSLGMGTYLGECDDDEDDRYVDVLAAGVTRGLNVFDTAINYRCQRSERAVGRALKRVTDSGIASRDEIIVCTKGGYVPLEGRPPESRDAYADYLSREYFDPAIITEKDLVAGGHCLTPGFIANQIERSRSNLGVDCIDLFYLHNPEQQLDTLDRPGFIKVMTDAFTELESQVSAGHIRAYGCATWNGFRVFAANRNHLSLGELARIAHTAGGDHHHFRFVQLPVNLAMTEAIRSPTQADRGKNFSLLDLALDLGISVVASAALMQAQLTRDLPAEVRNHFPGLATDAQRAVAFVRSLPVISALVGTRSVVHLEENIASSSDVN
ncbi:MAG: aldo/keto reductase [Gemmatimonadaceae bacterium]